MAPSTQKLPFDPCPSCYPRIWLHTPRLLPDWILERQAPASDLPQGACRFYLQQFATPGPGWPRTPQGAAGFLLETFTARSMGMATLVELQAAVDGGKEVPLGVTYIPGTRLWMRFLPGSAVLLNEHEMRVEMLDAIERLRLAIVMPGGGMDWTRDPQLTIPFFNDVYEWAAMYARRAASINHLLDPIKYDL